MPAPSTIAEVIARMRTVESSARPSDGVVCFTHLYLRVTESVSADLTAGRFAASRFLERLDVVFAGLFFDALAASAPPHAWAPLFESRARRGIAPLQFAFAGMNAHVNRDLPAAIVATCEELGVEPRAGSPEHADFERVNEVLARVERRIKASYLTGFVATLDRIVHRVHRIDDVVAMWEVGRARQAAWTNAETLWALRGEAALRAEFMDVLDRTVGFAGRGLLVPADTLFRRTARALRL